MSNLGLVNRLFFQFLFVRLTKNQETKMINYQPVSYDLTPNGVAARGYGDIETTEWYSIQYWILPFSEWGMGKRKTQSEKRKEKKRKK